MMCFSVRNETLFKKINVQRPSAWIKAPFTTIRSSGAKRIFKDTANTRDAWEHVAGRVTLCGSSHSRELASRRIDVTVRGR
jgi:hypothetical protein